MINYLVFFLFIVTIGFLGYYTFYLFYNSGGSILYQNVAISGILGLAISLISLLTYANNIFSFINLKDDFSFYSQILFVVFIFILFKVWEIRHNQVAKQNYKILFFILSLMNIILIFNNKYNYFLLFDQEITLIAPILLNIFILGIIDVLFFRFNKLSGGSDFKIFPITILILILINIAFIVVDFATLNNVVYYLFLLLQSGCFLMMVRMCINDYKKSFYY